MGRGRLSRERDLVAPAPSTNGMAGWETKPPPRRAVPGQYAEVARRTLQRIGCPILGLSSDASPTRPEWAVTRASTPAALAAAANRSPTICGESGNDLVLRSTGPAAARCVRRARATPTVEPHVPRIFLISSLRAGRSLRPPLGKAKRAAVRLPTSVHDPRSRCSTSSGIDVPLPGIRDLRGVSTVRAGIDVRRPVRPRASNRKIISGTYH